MHYFNGETSLKVGASEFYMVLATPIMILELYQNETFGKNKCCQMNNNQQMPFNKTHIQIINHIYIIKTHSLSRFGAA